MTTLMFHATLATTALTLITLALWPKMATQPNINRTMKLTTTLSLMPMLLFTNLGMQHITTSAHWQTSGFTMQTNFMFDTYATTFLPVALLITSAILDFASWYMHSEPHLARFTKYLLLFLIAMITLTTANNLLQLFVGWESVGIMSFLLIGWWHARANAVTSALQAIVYNRVGDIGLILAMAWMATNYNTWEMQLLFAHQHTPTLPLLGLVLAAAGKSAQFGLHPWLPAAMEGPTPVSALLHSSTMVIAGIFLLVRLQPLFATSQTTLTTCLCLGATTTAFASLCALTQNDIKKIIAFSTSSQLGLMMVTVGMNMPELAFLHITTHAFFKAMLFLCSGTIIHNFNNEQDIRKMGGTQKTLPITSACLTLGSLALAGTPFLAGFYTKDLIIEAMCTSTLNAWALLISTLTTTLTAAYSLRLIFYTQTGTPRHAAMAAPSETSRPQTRPILLLATGSTMFGLIITAALLPTTPQTMTMAPQIKLLALGATLLGLICTLDLMNHTSHLTKQNHAPHHAAMTQLTFFNTTMHRLMPKTKMTTAQTLALQLNDLLWYQATGPNMLKTTNSLLANKMSSNNTRNIKTHLMLLTALTTTYFAWAKLRHP